MRSASLTLVKSSVNNLNPDTIQAQLGNLASKAVGKTLKAQGWAVRTPDVKKADTGTGHTYTATLTFRKHQERERDNSEQVFNRQFEDITRKAISAGRAMAWYAPDEQPTAQATEAVKAAPCPQTFTLTIPQQYASNFVHIFDRDSQIRIILSALETAIATDFRKRNHCVLWGKPACGKTEILLALARMLGPDSVLKLDATSTTKAGAENLLLELDRIPPVILIEELEKCNPVNLPWLLGVMDDRGEIIKTNARVGSIRKEARSLILATVNNMAEFKTIMSGALASRFVNKVYCPRPNRKILSKILLREVREIPGGDPRWIRPALDWCLNEEKTDDPRRVKAVLDGRDKLLTGEYQADLRRVRDAMVRDGLDPDNPCLT